MAKRLAVIGGGNMARAIVRGAIDGGAVRADEVVVVEPDAGKRAGFAVWGVASTGEHGEGLRGLDASDGMVLLAVKPKALGEVGGQIRGGLMERQLVVSILAGMPAARVRAAIGAGVRVVCAMPNTGVQIRRGITAISAGEGVGEAQVAGVERLFAALGPVVRIEEPLMDAFTALAGSGPAYLFYLAEGMMRAGVEAGFTPEVADRVVRQTLLGAAHLLSEAAEQSPGSLRAAVTSKGGTTEAAVGLLDEAGMIDAVVRAILKGRDRGRELGGGDTLRA